jgi:hypothetical protein
VTLFVTYISPGPNPNPTEVHQLEYQFAFGKWRDTNLSAQPAIVGQAVLAPAVAQPAAYLFRAQGTAHVIYVGSASPSSQDLQIQEFWHDQNGWHANNLTGAAGGAPSPASASSPIAYAAEFQQTQHVHYVGVDEHLHELWSDTDGWHHHDLTLASGAPLAQRGTSPAGFVSEVAQTQHVYFVGKDSQLHGIRWKAGNWSPHEPLGGMPASTTASPVGYISDDGFERVSYVGLDGHVHELSLEDTWDLQDPSLETNTSVDPYAELAAYSGLEPGTRRIIVIPRDGHLIQQLSYSYPAGWKSAVLLDSKVHPRLGADNGARPGAFAVPAARQEYVYYPSIDFRVIELAGPLFPEPVAD